MGYRIKSPEFQECIRVQPLVVLCAVTFSKEAGSGVSIAIGNAKGKYIPFASPERQESNGHRGDNASIPGGPVPVGVREVANSAEDARVHFKVVSPSLL